MLVYSRPAASSLHCKNNFFFALLEPVLNANQLTVYFYQVFGLQKLQMWELNHSAGAEQSEQVLFRESS